MSHDLQKITEQFFQYKEIEYESEEDSIQALLPEELCQQWQVDELAEFDFSGKDSSGIAISLESDWIEKFLASLGGDGIQCFYLPEPKSQKKQPDFEKILSTIFQPTNAIYKIISGKPQTTIYSTLLIKITATSDEKREMILPITINESNFLLAPTVNQDILDQISPIIDGKYSEHKKLARPLAELNQPLRLLIESICKNSLSSFQKGMERRMMRDLERLYQYYSDMQDQIIEKSATKYKKDSSHDFTLEQQRLISIEKEYRAKILDVQRKYDISLQYEVLQWLRNAIPVYRIAIKLQRRKDSQKLFIDYNLLTKKPDSFYCQICGRPNEQFLIEDKTLKLIGPCCS